MSETTTQLYRHYHKDGALLYVGISLNAVARLAQHRSYSEWFNHIGKIEVEEYTDRNAALDAERKAIIAEQPLWNKTHKKPAPDPKPTKAEGAKEQIVRNILFNPLYSIDEVAHALSMTLRQARRLILEGQLAFITVPGGREGWKEQVRITGWQLIDYIEQAERKNKK
jgi:predicted GIY-YIG superfamily endonuclease